MKLKHKEMVEWKSSISKAGSYKKIGEIWGTHDLSKYWRPARRVKFEIPIKLEKTIGGSDTDSPMLRSSTAKKKR
jgi:hypothetical protein